MHKMPYLTLNQQVPLHLCDQLICVLMTMYNCGVHSTALISCDNFPSYYPDSHHSSDDVC